jgi:hypothetical protein
MIVAKLKFCRPDGESFNPLDKTPPVGAAAELAIGYDLQAGSFLLRHGRADAAVLDGGELLVVDAFGYMILEGLAQFGRPQQAANMIGAERWSAGRTCEHRVLPDRKRVDKANMQLSRVEQIKRFRVLPKVLDPEVSMKESG